MILIDLLLPISQLITLFTRLPTVTGNTTMIALGTQTEVQQVKALSRLNFELLINEPADYSMLASAGLPRLHLVSESHDHRQRFLQTVDLSILERVAVDNGIAEFDRRKSAFLDSLKHHVRLLDVLTDQADYSLLVDEAAHLSRRLEKHGALHAAQEQKKYAMTVRNSQRNPREAFSQAEKAINSVIKTINAFHPATLTEKQP